jgi:hypothetical protein
MYVELNIIFLCFSKQKPFVQSMVCGLANNPYLFCQLHFVVLC